MHVAVARPSRRRSVSVKAVTFTDYGIKAENIPDTNAVDPGGAYDSIGDRWLDFTLFLGESPTWSGPGSLVLYDLEIVPGHEGAGLMRAERLTRDEVAEILRLAEEAGYPAQAFVRRPVCRFCGHIQGKMDDHIYCLGCQRCGQSHLIPPAPLRERVRQRQRDGRLRGGIGS